MFDAKIIGKYMEKRAENNRTSSPVVATIGYNREVLICHQSQHAFGPSEGYCSYQLSCKIVRKPMKIQCQKQAKKQYGFNYDFKTKI